MTHSPPASEPQSTHPRAVFLVGFMGAGKTSVGQLLSDRLGWRFVDLDTIIEASAGRRVAEIFEQSGEAAFRQMETDALRKFLQEIPESSPVVVALGGGAFAQARNIELLEHSEAHVIFLDAPVDELRRRIGEDDKRPLFADFERFRLLFEQRQVHYRRATWRIQTDGKTVAEVAREIEFLIGER